MTIVLAILLSHATQVLGAGLTVAMVGLLIVINVPARTRSVGAFGGVA